MSTDLRWLAYGRSAAGSPRLSLREYVLLEMMKVNRSVLHSYDSSSVLELALKDANTLIEQFDKEEEMLEKLEGGAS